MSYSADGSEARIKALQEIADMDEVITATIAERRRKPKDDAITSLVKYRASGVAFTEEELHGLVKMLLFGGLDTTMAAASNAFLYLSQHPDDRQRLIDEPQLIPAAVEELLRHEAPVHAFARNVMADTLDACKRSTVNHVVLRL